MSEFLVIRADRLSDAAIGQEIDLLVRGRVRRIEADHVDVTGYTDNGDTQYVEGHTYVTLTVMGAGKAVPC